MYEIRMDCIVLSRSDQAMMMNFHTSSVVVRSLLFSLYRSRFFSHDHFDHMYFFFHLKKSTDAVVADRVRVQCLKLNTEIAQNLSQFCSSRLWYYLLFIIIIISGRFY